MHVRGVNGVREWHEVRGVNEVREWHEVGGTGSLLAAVVGHERLFVYTFTLPLSC